MKVKLMAVLLVLTSNVFAASDVITETVSFNIRTYVTNINCITPIGSNNTTHTVLSQTFDSKSNLAIQIPHVDASLLGCNTEALDQIAEDSNMRFGFIPAVVTLTKTIEKSGRIVSGRCQKLYTEQLTVDFDHGISLTSRRVGKTLIANDCQ